MVYNRAIVYKRQIFYQVVVHAIITDQWNSSTRLYNIQETVIYSRAILVSVQFQEDICKTLTVTLINSADLDQTQPNANYRELRVK